MYEFNEAAEPIAERLIDLYHRHLRDIKIAYVFKGEETDAVPIPNKAGKQRERECRQAYAPLHAGRTAQLGHA